LPRPIPTILIALALVAARALVVAERVVLPVAERAAPGDEERAALGDAERAVAAERAAPGDAERAVVAERAALSLDEPPPERAPVLVCADAVLFGTIKPMASNKVAKPTHTINAMGNLFIADPLLLLEL
jgi:hypothetical protein